MSAASASQPATLSDSREFPSRAVLAVVVWAAILLCVVYRNVIQEIVYQWQSDEDMAHGFFVPMIAGYIVWERWSVIRSLARNGFVRYWPGLALIVWAAIQLAVGTLGAELLLQRTSFLIALTGVILYLFGPAMLRALAFPLLLLPFTLQVPGIILKSVTFPLQLTASSLAEHILDLLGITVVRDGNVLNMAGQQISVVEACSGIRALLSLAFFSLCYAYLIDRRVWVRWAMLAASVPVALAANATRVVTTGILGQYNQALAEGFFHSFSGWLVFVLAIGFLAIVHVGIVRLFGAAKPGSR